MPRVLTVVANSHASVQDGSLSDRPEYSMNIDYLIVATDLTNYASTAARWAHNMNSRLGAEVVLCHVIEVTLRDWFRSSTDSLNDDEFVDEARAHIDTWYRDVTGESPDRIELRAGSPHRELNQLVDELDGNSIIVTAMSGKGAAAKFFLGSTARMIASEPTCPVIIVHPDHEYPLAANPIVVGTDFSPNAESAIEFSFALAREISSSVSILHANPAPMVSVFDGGEIPVGLLQESADAWSKTRMSELESRLNSIDDIDIETMIVRDDAARALSEHVQRLGSDLIVLGHSGESRLARTILGSVAQRVLNKMPTTLVIVPNP